MIWMDVDAALASVPVNVMPLIDDTDFKTIEAALTYNQAGLALYWNFTTTAGVTTVTAVTPTTGGDYDWTDFGTSGMYGIEIPASGGASANNDTEGFGHFTGVATGVLPWCGPMIGFRAAGLNNKLIDDAYSATRGLAGTALPAAVADAAGGLPISDDGGLDIDEIKVSTDRLTAVRAAVLTDWIDAGRLDVILDAIKAKTDGLNFTGSDVKATLDGEHVTLADGAHGGTSAVLTLERAIIASTTADEPGIKTTGNVSGAGMECVGGTSGGGGIIAQGGGANGTGIRGIGGFTTGHGMQIVGLGTGHGLFTRGLGVGDGINAIAEGAGKDIRGDIEGSLSGSVGSVAADVTADVVKLGGNATALATLLAMYKAITTSTVDDATFTPTTTAFEADLTEATDDHFNNLVCVFATGALAGQAKKITDYDGTEKRLTTEAFTEAPSDGDQFLIVGLVA